MRSRIIPAVPAREISEEIVSLTVNFGTKSMSLILGEVDTDGKVISHRTVTLDEQAYNSIINRADIFRAMDLLGID